MRIIKSLIDLILHLDKHLANIIQNYGMWTYGLLFVIIFCETGLVFTPFLPGDSILFATGALASIGSLNIFTLFFVFFVSAVAGDTVNYNIGKKIGTSLLEKPNTKLINKEYLNKAQHFYEKHGSMTIVLGRFIPIIRTFVPFVAGIGNMHYGHFITYNLLGGFLWVTFMLGGGYFFGQLPIVKDHFSFVVIAIVLISIVPAIVAFLKEKKSSHNHEDDVIDENLL